MINLIFSHAQEDTEYAQILLEGLHGHADASLYESDQFQRGPELYAVYPFLRTNPFRGLQLPDLDALRTAASLTVSIPWEKPDEVRLITELARVLTLQQFHALAMDKSFA